MSASRTTLRWMMAIGAVSLLVAAALHAGIVIPGPFDSAATYETVIAGILAVGIGLTFVSAPWSRWAILATLVVSLAGASVGLFLATRGLAPNTTIDVVYHVALVAWLLATVVVAWRATA